MPCKPLGDDSPRRRNGFGRGARVGAFSDISLAEEACRDLRRREAHLPLHPDDAAIDRHRLPRTSTKGQVTELVPES